MRKEDLLVYERFFTNVIIADVRYKEEIIKMKEKYPLVTAIYVESLESQQNLTNKQKAHITEHALDNYTEFDYVINYDEDNLQLDIAKIMEDWK